MPVKIQVKHLPLSITHSTEYIRLSWWVRGPGDGDAVGPDFSVSRVPIQVPGT